MNEEWDDSLDKISKNKKEKPYRSTKRKIKKYIPKEKDLSHITILDGKKKQGKKIIDTDDIKEQAIIVSGIRINYGPLATNLERIKRELSYLKHDALVRIRHLEGRRKELEQLKQALKERNELLRKEIESPGYLRRKRIELLEKARRRMEEDNAKEEERKELENYIIANFDLESLKNGIEYLEKRIEYEFEGIEEENDTKNIYSHKLEEHEEIFQKLEPTVKMLKDKLDEETKKLKAMRSNNLMKLFNKEERD